MRNRQIMWGTLGAVTAYCVSGWFIPDPYVSSIASLALFVFGVITLLRYAPVAYDIVVHGEKYPHRDGSHLAVLGTALLAAGAVYVGLFGVFWTYNGQPAYWLGTPVSGFGRALMAAGFWLMYASPDVVRRDMRVPGLAWVAIIVIASVLVGVFLGTQLEIR